LSFPGAQTSTDQPVPALKTLLEVPSFVFGLFGGQSAQTVMANSPDVQRLDGWRPVGFIQGFGWTDTQLPSMVGLFVTLVAFAVVIVAIRRFTPERIIAVGFLLFAFLAVLFGYRAVYDFSTAAFFQPRYLIPLTLVVLGVAYSTSIHQIFNKLQGSIIFIMLFAAGSFAWLATTTRYAVGPNAAYTNFGRPTVWWWEFGPSRMAWFVLSMAALAIWIYVAVFLPITTKYSYKRGKTISGPSDSMM
jgi:hypothetical protein